MYIFEHGLYFCFLGKPTAMKSLFEQDYMSFIPISFPLNYFYLCFTLLHTLHDNLLY